RLKDFYENDRVNRLECVEQAKRLKDEVICIMKQAGLNLRKWATNSSELRNELEVKQANTQSKVLGIKWNQEEDTLSLNIPDEKAGTVPTPSPVMSSQGRVTADLDVLTMRKVLQITNSVFDPLGLVEPVRLKHKHFLQKLWSAQLAWDEPIAEDIANEFRTF